MIIRLHMKAQRRRQSQSVRVCMMTTITFLLWKMSNIKSYLGRFIYILNGRRITPTTTTTTTTSTPQLSVCSLPCQPCVDAKLECLPYSVELSHMCQRCTKNNFVCAAVDPPQSVCVLADSTGETRAIVNACIELRRLRKGTLERWHVRTVCTNGLYYCEPDSSVQQKKNCYWRLRGEGILSPRIMEWRFV